MLHNHCLQVTDYIIPLDGQLRTRFNPVLLLQITLARVHVDYLIYCEPVLTMWYIA